MPLQTPRAVGGRRQSDHGGRFVGLAVEANRIGTLGITSEGANRSVERAEKLAGALGPRLSRCTGLRCAGSYLKSTYMEPDIPVRTAAMSDVSRFPRLSRPLG